MKVEFSLLTDDMSFDFVNESEIFLHPEKYQDYLNAQNRFHLASLTIGDQDQQLTFIDEMWYFAMHLCFFPLPKLLQGEALDYRIMNSGKLIHFVPEEKIMRIVSFDGKEYSMDKQELLKALYACGSRYLKLLTDVLPHRGHENVAAQIQPYADAARKALEEHGID